MPKKLPVRYVTEEMVKQALKIDSFRNLSKEKIMEFTSLMPYMDKDIAISIINQFPVFADFGKTAIQGYLDTCDKILSQNHFTQAEVIKGYQFTLKTLSEQLDKEEYSETEKLAIIDKMILINKELAEFDAQNKKFLLKMVKYTGGVLLLITATIAAGIGINSKMNSNNLPQLEDDDKKEV